MESNNFMLTIIEEILAPETTPMSILAGQDGICQLYKYDLARSFIRKDEDLYCHPLFVCSYQNKPVVNGLEEGDLKESYYRYLEDKDIDKEIVDNDFIHTTDFHLYQEKLEVLGYTPNPDKEVKEACISFVRGKDAGVLGFFVFERYDTFGPLTKQEIEETKALLLLMAVRIENFETKKQLVEEEKKSVIDKLTGLPLFGVFKEEAKQLIQTDNQYAIIYLDVDKFKYINDLWSHETGDDILIELANIIQSNTEDKECCCRIEDDKFVMLVQYDSTEDLDNRICYLNCQFQQMQKEKFGDVKITVIGGIYKIGQEKNIELLIDRANMARTSSKGNYDNKCTIYDQSLENLSAREKQLENRIAQALENNEFVPFLQPKFDVYTNQICGAEALARWQMEDKMISPAEFIPLFEKNGFITYMDFAIYEATLAFMHRLIEKGHDLVPISMNVSRGHMTDETFCSRFLELLDKYQIPVSLIELEVTESVFMADKCIITTFISKLRDHGITVSIDDFGTEYSSLNLLKDIEVDIIKLDKSFIDDLLIDKDIEKNKVIIKNIVTMIHELGFKIIVEGVEAQEQVDYLKEVDCHYVQGFLFSRPLPLHTFEEEYYK